MQIASQRRKAALARVPEVARRAIEQSGVSGVAPGELLGSSSVTTRGNADLLSFTVENGDPDVAATLVNAYAGAYTEYRLELDTASLANARKDLERNLAELRQQGATDTSLYRSLAQKVQELRTMELLQTRAEVVKTATSGAQVAPTPRRNAMLGAALGLLLGLGAVFLWEALDRRVRDEEEIHRRSTCRCSRGFLLLVARASRCSTTPQTRTPRRCDGCGRASSSRTST